MDAKRFLCDRDRDEQRPALAGRRCPQPRERVHDGLQEGVVFNDTLTRALYGQDGGYLGELGAGTALQRGYTVMDVGSIMTTGNMLDIAIQSREGFFAVDLQRADGKNRLETKG